MDYVPRSCRLVCKPNSLESSVGGYPIHVHLQGVVTPIGAILMAVIGVSIVTA